MFVSHKYENVGEIDYRAYVLMATFFVGIVNKNYHLLVQHNWISTPPWPTFQTMTDGVRKYYLK